MKLFAVKWIILMGISLFGAGLGYMLDVHMAIGAWGAVVGFALSE